MTVTALTQPATMASVVALDAAFQRPMRRLKAGHMLFADGDQARDLYEIVSGIVKLYKLMADGRCQIVGFLYAGHLIGVGLGDRHIYTAEAVSASDLRVYDRKRLEAAAENDPAFLRRLTASATADLRAAQDHMILLGRKGARERLASFLLALTERGPGGHILDVPMSRQDIGDYLGLTMETVSRTFSQFRDKGFIRPLTQRRLMITRPEDLQALADGEIDIDEPATHRTPQARRAAWPA